jgi:hypothetical protein
MNDRNVDFEMVECLLPAVEQTVDSVYLFLTKIDSLVETEDMHPLKRQTG